MVLDDLDDAGPQGGTSRPVDADGSRTRRRMGPHPTAPGENPDPASPPRTVPSWTRPPRATRADRRARQRSARTGRGGGWRRQQRHDRPSDQAARTPTGRSGQGRRHLSVHAHASDVIGAGPAYTDRPGATGASYLLRLGNAERAPRPRSRVVREAGGTLDPATLDTVVISHLHPDHFIDLVPLRHYLRWEQPRRRVRVIGPAASANALMPCTTSLGSALRPSTSNRSARGC